MKKKSKRYLAMSLVVIMLLSLMPSFSTALLANAQEQDDVEVVETDIPENHLRVHFESGDLNVEDLRLWVYEDVATWSEELGSWPNGMVFPEGQATDYGPYVDIELAEDPELVEFIVIYEGDHLLGSSIKINMISEEMNEVWVSREGDVSLYEPVELEENHIRIHWYNEEGIYEPWGLWLWGDLVETSESRGGWPTGAYPFSDDQVGKYGAYIDVEYKEAANVIRFLYVNRETEEQFGEVSFSDLGNHDQIFVNGEDNRAYTNPYYVREVVEQVETNATIPEWSKNSVLYEVNVRQYTEEGTFEAFEEHLPRLQELGVDILWFMPIHPISEERRMGELGSYYAVQDYTAINPEFGTMEDFQRLVDTAQDMGFYVVLDWVANHTGWDHAWIEENPEYYEKNDDGDITHVEEFGWTDVAQLDYSNEDMRQEMKEAMLYWVEEVGVDGYRADYATGVPKDFWEEISAELNAIKPVFMLAEDNMRYDFLEEAFFVNWGWAFHHIMIDIADGSSDKSDVISHFEEAKELYPIGTYPMQFLTSHDENSWEGTINETFGDAADAMAALYFTVPGIPLIYSGQEAGLDKRLNFFDKDEIDWSDLSMQAFYQDLIQLKKDNEALWNGAAGGDIVFLDTSDDHLLAFEREMNGNKVVVMMNLSDSDVSGTVHAGSTAGEYVSYFEGTEFVLEETHSFDFAAWEYIVLAPGQEEGEPEPTDPEIPVDVEDELQRLKDLINELQERNAELEKENEAITKELEELKARYEALEKMLSERDSLIEELEKELESLRGATSDGDDSSQESKETSLSSDKDTNKDGGELPDTSTSMYNVLLIGSMLFLVGAGLYLFNRKKALVK
ncbi:pullulanase-associated domain-containing protein [Evansella cellulosilytica]|uniref:LPXTG-motif cell wall anchor domain protein n=1 Tax=Evansella cellulosilytica (strain ATCC 21833 / DSM 2522 / FERM P-1141 / JCM 9156 / N-4) TaxID=649639 RepID=E6TTZ7_EVAC2|nr:pullulanase-associated domain-containing protein [Evansella cellulosilytica]ADU32028.1 LPXTG-motif cell wall anchor domain protein [Evansella cellulosilytica DSM 2522]